MIIDEAKMENIFNSETINSTQRVLSVVIHALVYLCVFTGFTCAARGLRDLLLVAVQVQRPLAQLLQVSGGGPAEALQRQPHVLLPDEQSLHHTFGSVQQVCEGNLEAGTMESQPQREEQRRCC